MNREIKFKFVLQDTSPKGDGSLIITESYTLDEILDEYGNEKIIEDLEVEHGCDGNCTTESVNFCECGSLFDDFKIVHKLEFTGLLDKNRGIEVYDGDIIINPSRNGGKPHQVKILDNGRIVGDYGLQYDLWQEMDEAEVIGNIYENAELLK